MTAKGLTICDATSAAFAMDLPWTKLDVVTFSWQKVLGGEGAHGMLILSPRAAARLESYEPAWPMPKLFRLTKDKKAGRRHVRGRDDQHALDAGARRLLDALKWAETIGGLKGLIERSEANLGALAQWVEKRAWVGFPLRATRSCAPARRCV